MYVYIRVCVYIFYYKNMIRNPFCVSWMRYQLRSVSQSSYFPWFPWIPQRYY